MNMNTNTISLLKGTLSRSIKNEKALTILEALILFSLGVLAMVIHAKLRIPMQLPGRQGLIFIALLIVGRRASDLPFAGSLFCAGAAGMQLTGVFGFHDPFLPFIYFLLGFWIDTLYSFSDRFGRTTLLVSLLGALSWVMIPLIRLVLSGFGAIPIQSVKFGPLYPIFTHLVFGFAGGLLGVSILKIFERKQNYSNPSPN